MLFYFFCEHLRKTEFGQGDLALVDWKISWKITLTYDFYCRGIVYSILSGLHNNFWPSAFIQSGCHPPERSGSLNLHSVLFYGRFYKCESRDWQLILLIHPQPELQWLFEPVTFFWHWQVLLVKIGCTYDPLKVCWQTFSVLLPFLVAKFYSPMKRKSLWWDNIERQNLNNLLCNLHILRNACQVILQACSGRVLKKVCTENTQNRS